MGSLIKELPRFEKHDRSCMLKKRLRQALVKKAIEIRGIEQVTVGDHELL